MGQPARLLNDAEVQELRIIKGQGLEVVLTLGTSLGSAIFSNGALTPHLELAHRRIHEDETYNEYVGNAVRHTVALPDNILVASEVDQNPVAPSLAAIQLGPKGDSRATLHQVAGLALMPAQGLTIPRDPPDLDDVANPHARVIG